MIRFTVLTAVVGFILSSQSVQAQPPDAYNYHLATESLILQGRQALATCNGLFVSSRTLEQVYSQELKLHLSPVVPPSMIQIDHEKKTVAIGTGGNHPIPTMRAAYREGLGCIVLAPDQTFDDLDRLPILDMPPQPGDPAAIPWPDGDLIRDRAFPSEINPEALQAAARWAFDRETFGHPSQITVSLLVVYQGEIVLERYAPGLDMNTRTRTWSTAKSIASTLIGILVGMGKLDLDAVLPYSDWGTGSGAPVSPDDPRRQITLRHVLNMSSGLYPVDNDHCNSIGSCLSYFAGASSAGGALDRGLVHPPGRRWDYENYDTILAVRAMKIALGNDQDYLEFPRRVLFDRIGMRNTLPGVDRFGDFVMSSQVYTNARDLARLGLLYLNGGRWNGEQILPGSWIDFVRTPAPSTVGTGGSYGGQWWLVSDDRTDVPPDAYTTAGHRGQYAIVIPSHDLVIVRRGLDWLSAQHGFDWGDLVLEVIKAFPGRPWGRKERGQSTFFRAGSFRSTKVSRTGKK